MSSALPPDESQTIRVLVCDDSPTYVAALQRLLERGCEIEVVAVCDTAEAAIAAIDEVRPDPATVEDLVPQRRHCADVEPRR